jgi:hypothetical protein
MKRHVLICGLIGGVLVAGLKWTEYCWANGRSRQIQHHGSIDSPEKLARDHQAVLKRVA